MSNQTHLPLAAQSTPDPERTIPLLGKPARRLPTSSGSAIGTAIEWSHLATWLRVVTRATEMGILPFIFESRLSESSLQLCHEGR